jgi:hypothetical protein
MLKMLLPAKEIEDVEVVVYMGIRRAICQYEQAHEPRLHLGFLLRLLFGMRGWETGLSSVLKRI